MTIDQSSREVFFDLTKMYEKEELKEEFISLCKYYLVEKKRTRLQLPVQLIERIFDFDFHRGDITHPISTGITRFFKDRGLRILKNRSKYFVNIIKKKGASDEQDLQQL